MENEKRATVRTSKTAADKGDSEKALQKEITELKAQLSRQTQLTEKAKAETTKVKEDWEKQKSVLETKLDKEKNKNKTGQQKKTGTKKSDIMKLISRTQAESVRRGSRSTIVVAHETDSSTYSPSRLNNRARTCGPQTDCVQEGTTCGV